MKKAIISLTIVLALIAAIAGATVAWEQRSKVQLEDQVAEFLHGCGVDPTTIDVHGRPYILAAAEGSVSLTYVDLVPQPGTATDQLLVHELTEGRAARLTRFVTFDHPAEEVVPRTAADGSFTDTATVDGKATVFSASLTGAELSLSANGRRIHGVRLDRPAEVRGVAATDAGVVVEVAYASPDCA